LRRDKDWLTIAVQRSVILKRKGQAQQHAITRIDFLGSNDFIPKEEQRRYEQIVFLAERLPPDRAIRRLKRLQDLSFITGKTSLKFQQAPTFHDDYRPRNNEYHEWPGTQFYGSLESSVYLSSGTLSDRVLPTYESEHAAVADFLDLPKFSSNDGRLGQIVIFVPNFNGRIGSLRISKDQLTVTIDTQRSFDDFILDVDYSAGDITKKVSKPISFLNETIDLNFVPTKLNMWLKSRSGYFLDYHTETPDWSIGVDRVLTRSERSDNFGFTPLDDLEPSHPAFDTSGNFIFRPGPSLGTPQPLKVHSASSAKEQRLERFTPDKRKQVGTRHAHGDIHLFCVGVDAYRPGSHFHSLKVCSADADAVADCFRTVGCLHANIESINVLSDRTIERPSRGNIIAGLRALASGSAANDRILFYFSGHGYRIPDSDEFYLVPGDAASADDPDTLLSFSRVREILNTSEARQKLIFLDACLSGPDTTNLKTPLANVSRKYLNEYLSKSSGVAILASSGSNQASTTQSPGGNLSLFTHFLTFALRGAPEALDDGFLTVDTLHSYLSVHVRKTAKSFHLNQKPIKHCSVAGEIVLGNFNDDVTSPNRNEPQEQAFSVVDNLSKRIDLEHQELHARLAAPISQMVVPSASRESVAEFESILSTIARTNIVNSLFPALNSLRRFFDSHPVFLKSGPNDAFYQKWLTNPLVENGERATSSMWTAQSIDELRSELRGISLQEHDRQDGKDAIAHLPFPRREPQHGRARFRAPEKPLGVDSNVLAAFMKKPTGEPVYLSDGPTMWLRVMPLINPCRTWLIGELQTAVHALATLPLISASGSIGALRAEDGCGVYVNLGDRATPSVCYVFTTGEIWAINAWLDRVSGYIPIEEVALPDSLDQCAIFLDRLGISGAYQWIAGIEGVEGWNLALRSGRQWGPCTANVIEERGEYKKGDDATESLRPFLQKVYDQCGALFNQDQRRSFMSGSGINDRQS
jgi:Caspase domain